MAEFISEDDLRTFDGWLKYQMGGAASRFTSEELDEWRSLFDVAMERARNTPKVGLMQLLQVPGEQRYAVAIEDGDNLWLTLWVKCAPKGDIYVFIPRGDRGWNPHTSYHCDGRFHTKSYERAFDRSKRQPLSSAFRGSEHLGANIGHGKASGAICDPSAFNGVLTVPPGILGPRDGSIAVDVVQSGYEPKSDPHFPLRRAFQRNPHPSVVITIVRSGQVAPVLRWPDDFVKL